MRRGASTGQTTTLPHYEHVVAAGTGMCPEGGDTEREELDERIAELEHRSGNRMGDVA